MTFAGSYHKSREPVSYVTRSRDNWHVLTYYLIRADDDSQWSADDGQWAADDGQWAADGGLCTHLWPLGDGVSMEAVGQIAPFWLEFSHNKYKYV